MESPSLISKSLLAVSILFPILATISVALRYYCRRIKSQTLKADDWIIFFALIMSWTQSANVYVAAAKAGVETTTLPPLQAAKLFMLCLWIEGFPLSICLAAIKISILLFYNRIFTIRPFRLSVYIAIVILVAWAFSTCIAQLLACDPIGSCWDPRGPGLRYDYESFSLAVAGLSLAFDILVLCFPLPVIRTLNMPTKRKVSVAGIFWLGAFCCVAAAVRIHFLRGSKLTYDSAANGFIWAYIEPNTSILAACLPTYAPLFASGGPSFISSLRSRIQSFISAGSSSARRFRQNKGSGGSTDMPSDGSGAGTKPSSGSSGDRGAAEMKDLNGKGRYHSGPKGSWLRLENESRVVTEIESSGREDIEYGAGLEEPRGGPLEVLVTKRMRMEEDNR